MKKRIIILLSIVGLFGLYGIAQSSAGKPVRPLAKTFPLPEDTPKADTALPGQTLPASAQTLPPLSEASQTSRSHLRAPSIARQVSHAMADSIEKVLPSVLVVKTSARALRRDYFQSYLIEGEVGQGSGVIIDPRGYFITNRHVLMNAESVSVQLADGREFEAEFIGANAPTDLAVLKIKAPPGTPFTVAEFADSDRVRIGELTMAIGSPYGFSSSVTHGIVSQKGRGWEEIPVVDFIQTSASINPGNSGGALVDIDGRLIGINTFIKTAPNGGGSIGLGFAVPSNAARRVATLIIEGKQRDLAYLGIFMGQTPYGVMITRTKPGGPAATDGIKGGDIVREIDGKPIATKEDFRTYMALKAPGDVVHFDVVRQNRWVKVAVKTTAVPALETLIKE